VETLTNEVAVADDGTNGPDPDLHNNTDVHTTTLDAAPDLVVTKDNGLATTVPGAVLTYTLTISNVGSQEATGIVITDILPVHTSFLAASHGGSETVQDSGVVIWILSGLPGKETTMRTVTVQVENPVPSRVEDLVNEATIADDGANGHDLDLSDNVYTHTTTLDAAPDLVVVKDSEITTTVPGTVLTYTLTVANVGTQDATGVDLTDLLPEHASFVGASHGGYEDLPGSGTVTWPGSGLAGGETITRTVTIRVDDPVPSGIVDIVNTAQVTDDGSNGPDLDPDDNEATHTIDIDAVPDLAVTKDNGITTTIPGAVVTYTLIVSNVGNQGSEGILLADVLPISTTFDHASDEGYELTPGLVVWYPFDLPGGESVLRTVTVRVQDPLPSGRHTIVNTVTVHDNGDNGTDPNQENNSYSHTTDVDAAPDLAVVKGSEVTTTAPGAFITYAITVTNAGNQDATGTVVTDVLPSYTAFESASPGAVPQNGVVVWPIGRFNAGQSAVLTLTIRVDAPVPGGVEALVNEVRIADDGTNGLDPDPDNDADSYVIAVEAMPDLVITKTNGLAVTIPGDVITYTLTISNVGAQGATGVVITDTLPDHTTFLDASHSGGETLPDSSVVIWPPFDLDGEKSITRTVTVQVHDPVPSGVVSLTNEAAVADDGANGPDPSIENNTCAHVTEVEATPDLIVAKTNEMTITVPGTVLTYTITITNAGQQDAEGIDVADILPHEDHITFVRAWPPGYLLAGGVVFWSELGLGGGKTLTRTVTIQVNDTMPDGVTEIVNVVQVSDDGENGPDPRPEDNVYTHTTFIDAAPDLVVTKDNDTLVAAPDDVLTYTLTIRNAGNQDAIGVVVTDTLPEHTTFIDASGDWTREGRTITWSIGSMDTGSSRTRTVAVSVDNTIPDDVGTITNTASVVDDGTNGPDLAPSDNVYTHTTVVSVAPDLAVIKDPGITETVPGEVLTYTLIIRNTGTQNATGVTVTDTLPDHTTLITASHGGIETEPDSGVVTWPAFDLDGRNHVTRTIRIVMESPWPGGVEEIVNTATVSDDGAKGSDPLPGSNRYDHTLSVNAAPDLVVSKTSEATTTMPGDILTYTITLSNAGDQSATGVELTDELPQYASFVSASDGGGEAEPGSGTVTWPLFDLPVGDTVTRTVTIRIHDPMPSGVETLTNTVTVADDGTSGPDRTPGDNTYFQTTTVDAVPDLVITKDNGVAVASPGDILTYTLTISNVGNQNATKLALTDELPDHTTFVSASDLGFEQSGVVVWFAFDLEGGKSVTRTVTIKVDDPISAGVPSITNKADIRDDGANGPDPTPDNNAHEQITDIDAAPDLVVTKTNDILVAAPGDVVTYTLTIRNTGNQDATGVTVTDTLPDHTTFDDASGGAHQEGTVIWLIGSLGAGSHRTHWVRVRVDDPLPQGVEAITNTVHVTDDGDNGPDLAPSDNVYTHTTIASAAPDLAIAKDQDVTGTVPGDVLTYTLTVINKGNQDATGVAVTDELPDHTTFASASDGGVEDPPGSGVVTWPALSLEGGKSVTRTVTVAIDHPIPSGIEVITNSASVSDDGINGLDPILADNTCTHTITIDAAPDLVITKTNGVTVTIAGDVLIYTITISNMGSQGATGVHVTDTVPDHTTLTDISDDGHETAPGSGLVTWPIFDLDGGTSTIRTVTLAVDESLPDELRAITNIADVTDDGTNGPDLDPADNHATVRTPIDRPNTGKIVYLPIVVKKYRPPCAPFFDDFDDPASGWPIRNDSTVQLDYQNGEYVIHSKVKEMRLVPAPTGDSIQFVLEVNARWQVPGDEYGLIFGLSTPLSPKTPTPPFYRFVVDPVQRRYRLKYYDGQGWECINQPTEPCWVDSSHIQAGSAPNHLEVECSATSISLYVNDRLLWNGAAPYPCSGWVGMETQSLSGTGGKAYMDNFRVSCSSGPSLTSVPDGEPQIPTLSLEPDMDE
jgi:uncharacterized repeat protein (TIGR01451 family)